MYPKYTRLQVVMEVLGALLVIGLLGFIGISWNQLPEQIPMHYNALGQVDKWSDKGNLIVMPIMSLLLYAGLTILSFFPQVWNVPVKVTDKNGASVYGCTRSLIIATKLEMVAIYTYLAYNMIKAQDMPASFLPIMLLLLFGTIIFFTVRIIRMGKKSK